MKYYTVAKKKDLSSGTNMEYHQGTLLNQRKKYMKKKDIHEATESLLLH